MQGGINIQIVQTAMEMLVGERSKITLQFAHVRLSVVFRQRHQHSCTGFEIACDKIHHHVAEQLAFIDRDASHIAEINVADG